MIAPTNTHHEEDDDEIENLRKIAMESLKKSRDNELSQEQQHFQSMNAVTHYSQPPESSSYDLEVLSYNHSFPGTARPPRMGGFHMQPRYRHPQHMNNFQPRHHMRAFAPHHHRPIIPPPIQQDFVPHPHVNPQFIAHQPPAMFVNNDFPPIEYVPTPAVRLSPRSAEFIAANEQAIIKASSKRSRSPPLRRRRSSLSRSRSPVPIPIRRRSRSPIKRKSPNENNFIRHKRYRSKSPENRPYKSRNNSPKQENRSKSPLQKRSQSPKNSRYNRKGRDTRYNGNMRYNRKRSESDKDEKRRSRSKSKDKDESKSNNGKVEETTSKTDVADQKKSLTPPPEEKSTTPPIEPEKKKEKTKEELEEDALLASTDDEDENQLDIIMDDNELDFLEDDSGESENEGRFKSKPSSNVKPTPSFSTNKSSYSSKSNFDKSKSYNAKSSRNDYRRDDKHSFKRKDYVNRKNSPDYRKSSPDNRKISPDYKKNSPNTRRRSPNERRVVVIKEDSSKNNSEAKPMFKQTFKSIDAPSEKKTESSLTSTSTKKSLTSVRSFIGTNKTESDKKQVEKSSVKSVINVNDDSSKSGEPRKRKIMDRLGDFIGSKGKTEGNRNTTAKQVFECRYKLKMKIAQVMKNKRNYWGSRNVGVSIK